MNTFQIFASLYFIGIFTAIFTIALATDLHGWPISAAVTIGLFIFILSPITVPICAIIAIMKTTKFLWEGIKETPSLILEEYKEYKIEKAAIEIEKAEQIIKEAKEILK